MRMSFLFTMLAKVHFLFYYFWRVESTLDLELMSPAGSREALVAAAQGSADAVYFGVGDLNMRAHAAHARFDVSDLPDITVFCNDSGLRSYLTVNTVLYDGDMDALHRLLDAAACAGVTAIIAADVAVMLAARERGLTVHLSTQLNIANFEALRFYAQFADAAVLARELTLEQAAAIHHRIGEEGLCGPSGQPLRLEVFAHGALCMAVSGKCYLSLHQGNRSANRGECLQICRRAYTVMDNDTGGELVVDGPYIMSPKDLKSIRFLDRMVAAGIRIFKIEGRARGPEYVRTVTACYREALDACRRGDFADAPFEEWDRRLASVFNRGFWDGYYLGRSLGEWTAVYGSAATRRKVYLARVIKYFSRLGVAEFEMESGELAAGDELLLTGPTTGALMFTADDIRVAGLTVPAAGKGQRFSIATPTKVRPSDRLYKMSPVA
jgi:putative protease